MSPPDDAPLAVGERVQIINMPEVSGLNGLIGTAVKKVGTNWALKVSDSGKTKVVSAANLQRYTSQPIESSPPATGNAAAPAKYSIVGTWDDWEPSAMDWNARTQCFESFLVMGDGGCESFKILLEGDWDRCIYPDCKDATPWMKHDIIGPDDGGMDEEWTIGVDERDDPAEGTRYRVRMSVFPGGEPKRISWEIVKEEQKTSDNKAGEKRQVDAQGEGLELPPTVACAAPVKAPHLQRWAGCSLEREKGEVIKQGDAVLARERAARERLTRRLEAAATIIRPALQDRDDDGSRAVLRAQAVREVEDQQSRVVANRERYRTSVRENTGVPRIEQVRRQVARAGICAECGESTTNMMGSLLCCEDCWAEWAEFREKGWNPATVCDGISAGWRAERLASDGTFSRAMARQYVMKQYPGRFE